jgi:hypothetical protein
MAVTYLELQPEYECTWYDEFGQLGTYNCTADMVCGTNNITDYWVKKSIYSLNNWIEQLDMYCTDGKYVGMIGALATQAIQLPMFFCAIFTHSLGVVYFMVFFLGFCLIGRFTCGFVLFVELLPEKYKAISGSAILIGYSISLLEVTAYYAWISQNSIPTIWLGFILTTVTFAANFILPESP